MKRGSAGKAFLFTSLGLLGTVFAAGVGVGASGTSQTPNATTMADTTTKDDTAPSGLPKAVYATSDQTPKSSPEEVNAGFDKCLDDGAKKGMYNPNDGGASAALLMISCPQYKDFIHNCMNIEGKTAGDCRVEAAVLSQAALKLELQ